MSRAAPPRAGKRLTLDAQEITGYHMRSMLISTLLAAGGMLASVDGAAQENADVLAKQLSNPVAALISVPLQYNVDFNIGSEDGTKHTLNIQPVIPHSLSENYNLITRIIVPVVDQDDVFGDSGHQFGLG